jgi:hypothetical protein
LISSAYRLVVSIGLPSNEKGSGIFLKKESKKVGKKITRYVQNADFGSSALGLGLDSIVAGISRFSLLFFFGFSFTGKVFTFTSGFGASLDGSGAGALSAKLDWSTRFFMFRAIPDSRLWAIPDYGKFHRFS